MGISSWLGFGRVPGSTSLPRSLATPWAGDNHLVNVTLDELWDVSERPVTRAEAMSVPAVARARHLIAGGIAQAPLRAFKDGAELADQPAWLYRTDNGVPPYHKMLWTVDDCMFYGWSLWSVTRGADGFPLSTARIQPNRWAFDATGSVLVDGQPVDATSVLLIPGPFEGLIEAAGRTIRGAQNLERNWQARVKNPIPFVEIRYTGDDDLDEDEMRDIRSTYVNARTDENGTVMVTPHGFEVHTHGNEVVELFVQGRNAVALDVARHTNVPAMMLDASNINAASVNYSNAGAKRSEYKDVTLTYWANAIAARLSMDDCVPRGTYVEFDMSEMVELPDDGVGPELDD